MGKNCFAQEIPFNLLRTPNDNLFYSSDVIIPIRGREYNSMGSLTFFLPFLLTSFVFSSFFSLILQFLDGFFPIFSRLLSYIFIFSNVCHFLRSK